ncbi:MAG: hypothetical protein JXP37_05530 [Coriobacteriia bacterium]|nr:hypothetical protein [Coriobacteriia bacterium]
MMQSEWRQTLRSPGRIVALFGLTVFAVLIASPQNMSSDLYQSMGEWYLAGQAFWMVSIYGSLLAALFTTRLLQDDTEMLRLDSLRATQLKPMEYLCGKIASALTTMLLPAGVLVFAMPLQHFLVLGETDVIPYVAAFFALAVPFVGFAVVACSGLGLVTGNPRAVIIGYLGVWAVSAFPFLRLPAVMNMIDVAGKVPYFAWFEWGDPGAVAEIASEHQPELISALDVARTWAPINVATLIVLIGAVLILVYRDLTHLWSAASLELRA